MDRVNAMLFQLTHSMDLSVIPAVLGSFKLVFAVLIFGYVLHWLPQAWKDRWMNWFIRIPHWVKAVFVVGLVFLIYQTQTSDLQPFIYFQF
jgi:dolichyl-phosphate-mannose--protein O-mannosyl transferase